MPSNLALHRFGARRWLARILLSWGIVATAMAFVPNATVLVVLRFLLGVAEAGFFPGIILYLTYWFPAEQRARAVALFMAAVPVSTAVGSVVSSLVIASGDGLFGLSGWRVMFLVEACRPSCSPPSPGTPSPTAPPTRTGCRPRTGPGWWRGSRPRPATSSPRRTGRSLTSPRILALAFVYFGIAYGLYALGFFLPTIIAGFEQQFGTKLSVVERGLVTAVPYVLAAVAMVLWARRADGARSARGASRYVAAPMLLGGLAIPVALYLRDPWTAMVAVSLCAVGVCAALPTFWALPSRFLTGAAAAGGIALVNSLGNISGFAAPYVTGGLADLTGSRRAGLWVVGATMVVAAGVALAVGTRIGRETQDATPIGEGAHPPPAG